MPVDHPFAIGIDLGTGSCKTVIIDIKGRLISQAAAPYPSSTKFNRWQEQQQNSLLDGLIQSVSKAIAGSGLNPSACLGLSVGGALHSLTALDREDRPLIGLLTWADSRAEAQAARLREMGISHDLYMQTGCPIHPLYPLAKILWLKEEQPDLYQQVAWFLSAKEYITNYLTGKRVVDYSIAGASGMLNTHSLTWDREILTLAGVRSHQLSRLIDPKEHIAGLDQDVAAKIGLLPGTPVYMGSSDAVNSSLGAGSTSPDQITCMVGTSGAIRILNDRPILDPQERTWCYAVDPHHWLVGGAINNGGLAVQWLIDALGAGLPPGSRRPEIKDIMTWAENIPAGSEGVICLPFFTAERSPNWNTGVRGVYYGMQLRHDQRHLSRALVEGIAFRLRSVYEVLKEFIPGSSTMRASGGFIQSKVWLQITADVLQQPLHIPAVRDTSGVAAAFWVLLGAGAIHALDEIGTLVPLDGLIEPNENNSEIYAQQYKVYTELYQALQPIFERNTNP